MALTTAQLPKDRKRTATAILRSVCGPNPHEQPRTRTNRLPRAPAFSRLFAPARGSSGFLNLCWKSGRQDLNLRPSGPEPAPTVSIPPEWSRKTGAGCHSRLGDHSCVYLSALGGMAGGMNFRKRGVRRRSLTRAREACCASLARLYACKQSYLALQRRGRDSNSRYANKTHNGFRDRRIQPLCHPSWATCPRLDDLAGAPRRWRPRTLGRGA